MSVPTSASARKSANLSVRGDLLAEARALVVNSSKTRDSALQAEVKRMKEQRWLAENRLAIGAYNRELAQSGLRSDASRLF